MESLDKTSLTYWNRLWGLASSISRTELRFNKLSSMTGRRSTLSSIVVEPSSKIKNKPPKKLNRRLSIWTRKFRTWKINNSPLKDFRSSYPTMSWEPNLRSRKSRLRHFPYSLKWLNSSSTNPQISMKQLGTRTLSCLRCSSHSSWRSSISRAGSTNYSRGIVYSKEISCCWNSSRENNTSLFNNPSWTWLCPRPSLRECKVIWNISDRFRPIKNSRNWPSRSKRLLGETSRRSKRIPRTIRISPRTWSKEPKRGFKDWWWI